VARGQDQGYRVTDSKRQEGRTEIPTVDEAGLPGALHARLARPLGAEEYAARRRH
jgi:hypothetical protein